MPSRKSRKSKSRKSRTGGTKSTSSKTKTARAPHRCPKQSRNIQRPWMHYSDDEFRAMSLTKLRREAEDHCIEHEGVSRSRLLSKLLGY